MRYFPSTSSLSCNDRTWTRLKPETGTSSKSPTWMAGAQAFGVPSAAFPTCYRGAGLEVEQIGLELGPI